LIVIKKENRIIIVSLVRSNEENKVGFLFKPNRINVALSRAKDRLVIIGNKTMWENEKINLPLGQVLRYIKNPQNNKSEYSIITVEG
jgi:superfamily I DNA and/or RNA helicase